MPVMRIRKMRTLMATVILIECLPCTRHCWKAFKLSFDSLSNMTGQIPLLAPFIGMWFTHEFMNVEKLKVHAYTICLGAKGQNTTVLGSWPSLIFSGAPHVCGYPPASARTPLFLQAPLLSQVAPYFCVCFLHFWGHTLMSLGTQILQDLLAWMLVITESHEI